MTAETASLEQDLRGVTDATPTICGGAAFVSPVSKKVLVFNGFKHRTAELLARSFASENRIESIAFQCKRLWAMAPESEHVQRGVIELYNPWMPCRPLLTVDYPMAGTAMAPLRDNRLVTGSQQAGLDVWDADPANPHIIHTHSLSGTPAVICTDDRIVYVFYATQTRVDRFCLVWADHNRTSEKLEPLPSIYVRNSKGARAAFIDPDSKKLKISTDSYYIEADPETGDVSRSEHLLDQNITDMAADMYEEDTGVTLTQGWSRYTTNAPKLTTRRHVAVATPRGVMTVDSSAGILLNRTDEAADIAVLPCRSTGYTTEVSTAVSNDGTSYVVAGRGRCEPGTAEGSFVTRGHQIHLWQADTREVGPVSEAWLPDLQWEPIVQFDHTGRWLFVLAPGVNRTDNAYLDDLRDAIAPVPITYPSIRSEGLLFVFEVGACGVGLSLSHTLTIAELMPDLNGGDITRTFIDETTFTFSMDNTKLFLGIQMDSSTLSINDAGAVVVCDLSPDMRVTGSRIIQEYPSDSNPYLDIITSIKIAPGRQDIMLVSMRHNYNFTQRALAKELNWHSGAMEPEAYTPLVRHIDYGDSVAGWAVRSFNNSDGVSSPNPAQLSGFIPTLRESDSLAKLAAVGVTDHTNFALVAEGWIADKPFAHLYTGPGSPGSGAQYDPSQDQRTDRQKWMDECQNNGLIKIRTNMSIRVWVNGFPVYNNESDFDNNPSPAEINQCIRLSHRNIFVRVEVWNTRDVIPLLAFDDARTYDNEQHLGISRRQYAWSDHRGGNEPDYDAKPWLGIADERFKYTLRRDNALQDEKFLTHNENQQAPEDFGKIDAFDFGRLAGACVLETDDTWQTAARSYPLTMPLFMRGYHNHELTLGGDISSDGLRVVNTTPMASPFAWDHTHIAFYSNMSRTRVWGRAASGQAFEPLSESQAAVDRSWGAGMLTANGYGYILPAHQTHNPPIEAGWNWLWDLNQPGQPEEATVAANWGSHFRHTEYAVSDLTNSYPGLPYDEGGIACQFSSSMLKGWMGHKDKSPYPRWVQALEIVDIDLGRDEVVVEPGQPSDNLPDMLDGSLMTYTDPNDPTGEIVIAIPGVSIPWQ